MSICDSHRRELRVHGTSSLGYAHLIGIAGAGMRSLAHVLHSAGWRISGSDLNSADLDADRLAADYRLTAGHAADHVNPRADLVVYSDAIPPDNVELRRALELGVPVLSYAQMLGKLMAGRCGLAVAGTHGKSTTAAMAAQVLVQAGLDPSYVIGAVGVDGSPGGRHGNGDVCLIEACEYRANFLHLAPRMAVLLPIEPDHFDYYQSPEQLEATFAEFAARLPADGLLLYAGDCPVSRRIAAGLECRCESFGLAPQCDWRADDVHARRGRYRFQLALAGRTVGSVELQVPGRHNVANATAAAALAAHCGVPAAEIFRSLARFQGLRRRLETVGTADGATILDDYAHHPTEVSASLAAVREMHPGRRVWCVFQPHQASRTACLLDEFARSLQNADRIIVADVYRAREPDERPGEIGAADLARRCRDFGADVLQVHAIRDIQEVLNAALEPLDVLITMGAGNIGKIAHDFHQRFRDNRAAG